MAKQCVQLNLALLGTVKYNSVTKTIKMFNLIPQIDNLGNRVNVFLAIKHTYNCIIK